YGQQLSKYLEKVRSEDLLILIYEEVFDAPEYWLQKIAEFLEVDTEWFSSANNVNNEKIFGSTSYRSKFLFNLLASLVKTLRSNRFTGKLVSFFKRKGIAGKIKSLNAKSAKYPQMDVQMKAELESYYKQDIKLLESILKRKIPSWEVN
ncbi:MAG: sulfotransferase domain-containing protein, partial [Marinoscillum sp.]